MKPSFDGILGLAIGDALGVPVEFTYREDLASAPVIDMESGGTYGMPAGCWSDDTSLTLATMDAIINNDGEINNKTYYSIANNFANYYYRNCFTPTGKAFDIGNTTRKAISDFATKGIHPLHAGGNSEFNEGNGALMRILPLAYYAHQNNLSHEDTQKIVNNVSSITHRLPTCKLGSYIYTEFARKLIEGASKEDAYKYIQSLDYSNYPYDVVFTYGRILQKNITDLDQRYINSAGKTLPTLEASLWSFMRNKEYKTTVLQAVNLGDDTDTIAAVAGGLAGIYYGINSIPENWIKTCKKVDYISDICSKFDKSIQKETIQEKATQEDEER